MLRLSVLLLALSCSKTCPVAYADGTDGWRLSWADEFDGREIDERKWSFDLGGNGWGNRELQTYTSRKTNAYIADGSLVIRVLKESFAGPDKVTRDFTSARLLTRKKFSQAYGRFEASIKIPRGQGIWPAFWLLGANIENDGWPRCGEIDIMENVGREPSVVHGTLHGPGYSGAKGITSSYRLAGNQRFYDSFHTFAVEWEPHKISFYVDGVNYKTRTPTDLPTGFAWVFDRPFFIIINVAVGGDFPGNPDATTAFPQLMRVDYVRVYERVANNKSTARLTRNISKVSFPGEE